MNKKNRRHFERKPHVGTTSETRRFIIVQPGGTYVEATVRGSDIAKIRARNAAMAALSPNRKDQYGSTIPPDTKPVERFMLRYKRHYVTDVETGGRVDLIMSREEIDRCRSLDYDLWKAWS